MKDCSIPSCAPTGNGNGRGTGRTCERLAIASRIRPRIPVDVGPGRAEGLDQMTDAPSRAIGVATRSKQASNA